MDNVHCMKLHNLIQCFPVFVEYNLNSKTAGHQIPVDCKYQLSKWNVRIFIYLFGSIRC